MTFDFLQKRRSIGCCLLIILFSCAGNAQKEVPIKVDGGKMVTIHSHILNEDRRILIYAPKDTLNPDKRYPVIYVLDADNHFAQMVEYAKYLSRQDVAVIPPLIVVGIANTDRNRDLTPSRSTSGYSGKPDTSGNSPYKNSGGNEHFFQFIQKELMPYVISNYRTAPYRIFAGHSFGGLTTINCLINHPEMFEAYIAVSPSLWWDQKFLLKVADQKLKAGSSLAKTLFLSDGNEDSSSPGSPFHANVVKLDSLLNHRNLSGLKLHYLPYPTESHMTVPIKSYYDGLRFIYNQWQFPSFGDEEITPELIITHYNALSQKYGYPIIPDESYLDRLAQGQIKKASTIDNGIKLLEMNAINYPSSPKAFMALGSAYLMKGRKQQAINAYEKANKLNPNSDEIRLRLRELKR